MTTDPIRKGYGLFAPVYDAIYGALLHPGRRLAVQSLGCAPGDRILEVGVGTGLSLSLYPPDVRVTGVDLAPQMLAKAAARIARGRLTQVEAVLAMDAERMAFADDSFDKVVAMYVVSVTPNPARLVEEMRRVCRPNGRIVIVNHFRADNWTVGALERLVWPMHGLFHFRPDMDLEQFLAETDLDVLDTRRTNLLRYSTLLHCRNHRKNAHAATRTGAIAVFDP